MSGLLTNDDVRALEIVREARELIAEKRNWGRLELIHTIKTGRLWWRATRTRYCAVGAMVAATGQSHNAWDTGDRSTLDSLLVSQIRHRLFPTVLPPGENLMGYNDGVATHEQVLAAFDAVIAKLEQTIGLEQERRVLDLEAELRTKAAEITRETVNA